MDSNYQFFVQSLYLICLSPYKKETLLKKIYRTLLLNGVRRGLNQGQGTAGGGYSYLAGTLEFHMSDPKTQVFLGVN
jgi:hypothetical protein